MKVTNLIKALQVIMILLFVGVSVLSAKLAGDIQDRYESDYARNIKNYAEQQEIDRLSQLYVNGSYGESENQLCKLWKDEIDKAFTECRRILPYQSNEENEQFCRLHIPTYHVKENSCFLPTKYIVQ